MPDTFVPFSGAMLLCMDMQASLLKAIPDSARIVSRCKLAISAAAGLGLHVAFTEQVPQKLGAAEESLLKCVSKPSVYSKSTFSALADDGIADAVKETDAEHLILCGVETSICIYQTALDAIDRNLQVTILSDAVGARRPDDAQICLRSLTTSGIYVLPTETVFYSLLRGAKHPFFKQMTELVKKHG